MTQIKTISVLFIALVLQACSTKPFSNNPSSVAGTVENSEIRKLSSIDQGSLPPNLANEQISAPPATGPTGIPTERVVYSPTDDKQTIGVSLGRKLVIPRDQENLARKCADKFTNFVNTLKNQDTNDKNKMGFDATKYTIKHRAYEISYNFFHLNPNWVYHRIHRENLKNSCGSRDEGFYADTVLSKSGIPWDFIKNKSAFKGSGYDRGHMAPSSDFLWNQEINKESFFMTNMSPQAPGLNQQTWKKLENRIREWACGNGELEVYTGPVLTNNLNKLDSCVSIPEKYFKVLAYYKNGGHHGIAFLYPQTDDKKDGDAYKSAGRAIPIRKLEELTGLDFFQDKYSKVVQDSFETSFDWADWDGTEDNCLACDGKLLNEADN